jgi:hypothetical protein
MKLCENPTRTPNPPAPRFEHVDIVADMLAEKFPAVAELLDDAKANITTSPTSPRLSAQDLVDDFVGTAEQESETPPANP